MDDWDPLMLPMPGVPDMPGFYPTLGAYPPAYLDALMHSNPDERATTWNPLVPGYTGTIFDAYTDLRIIEYLSFPHFELNDLPDALIAEIMAWLTIGSVPTASFRITDTPAMLRRVCRRWDAIALRTPEIWASMAVLVSRHLPRDKLLAFLKWHLLLSDTYPLNFSLSSHDGNSEGLESVLELFVAHAERWHTVAFEMHIRDLLSMSRAIKGRLPRLQRLRLDRLQAETDSVLYPFSQSSSVSSMDAFETAPSLRSVELLNEFDPHCVVPLSRSVTNFSFATPDPLSAIAMLKSLPLLETLYLVNGTRQRYGIPNPTKHAVVLPHLKILHLQHLDDGARAILDCISAPSLCKIWFVVDGGVPPLSLVRLLAQAPKLMEVGIWMRKEDFKSSVSVAWILQRFNPGVERLLLQADSLRALEGFLCALKPSQVMIGSSVTGGDMVCCPALKHMQIDSPSAAHDLDVQSLLADVIHARVMHAAAANINKSKNPAASSCLKGVRVTLRAPQNQPYAAVSEELCMAVESVEAHFLNIAMAPPL